MGKWKLLFKDKGQALVETAITFPIILFLILSVIQFAIIITCQMGINFAAYRGARAVLLSSNCSHDFGYGNSNNVLTDVQNEVKKSLISFYPVTGLGWILPDIYAKTYWHNNESKKGFSKETGEQIILPNRTLWVFVKARVNLNIPFMRFIFGDNFFLTWRTIRATCLVTSPAQVGKEEYDK